jgi:ribonuclease HI
MNELFIFTDGGARGNPGPAAVGVYITDEEKKEIKSIGKKIGHATNNIAEYEAVITALNWLIENKVFIKDCKKINFYLDSQLVYSQISGVFRIKNSELREKLFAIREREAQIQISIHYNLIPREQNEKADFLVNKALDNLL